MFPSIIDISLATVTASNQTYNGSALTPTPTVTLNGETVPGSGYDVSYSNNTNAGTATVTVTGKGDYTGTASGTFTINQATGSVTTVPTARTITYSGSGQYLVTAGSGTGTIYYRYRYKSYSASSWGSWSSYSTSRPSRTNAGYYEVEYYAAASSDGNYSQSATGTVSCEIYRASRTLSFTTAPTSVEVDNTITVVATPSAGGTDGTITYSSGNTSVATVSGNVVTGISVGSVTISASISAGTNYKAATKSYTLSVTAANYALRYLTFKAIQSGTFTFTNRGSGDNIQYSTDGGSTWTALASGVASPTVDAGSKILWKSTRTPATTTGSGNGGIGTFSATGNFDLSGNIMSLAFGDNFANQLSLTGKNYMFSSLFLNCTKVVNAKDLALPATTLIQACYAFLFQGCTALVSPPVLPATTLAASVYGYMFNGCTSLTYTPALPATSFGGGTYVYNRMFAGCTSLTDVPEVLPAKTLTNYCYQYMFQGCTSLTKAPKLPALTLASYSYQYMFDGCTSLNEIVSFATNISATNSTTNWVRNVASSGIFRVNTFADCPLTSGANGIPSDWKIIRHEMEKQYFTIVSAETSLSNIIKWKLYGSTDYAKTIYISTDNGNTWTEKTSSTSGTTLATLSPGKKLLIKGQNSRYAASQANYSYFSVNGKYYVEGNIMSLVSGDSFVGSDDSISAYAFTYLFKDSATLQNAENLILSSKHTRSNSYARMFYGCTSLTGAPVISYGTTRSSTFMYYMYYGCSKLNVIKYFIKEAANANYCTNWVYGVASNGTFYRNPNSTWNKDTLTRGMDTVPEGWDIVDAELDDYL